MVTELPCPTIKRTISTDDVLRSLIFNGTPRTVSPPTIHPPVRLSAKHIEPTSALQLARELADLEIQDAGLLKKLAELTAIQLRQGTVADRLQLFFALNRLFNGDAAVSKEALRITQLMLCELRPLFANIAPRLRWTALASLATIIDRPCFSRTSRRLAAGYICAFIPEAVEDAAPHDKAAVYSMLLDLSERGFVKTANNARILAGLTKHLPIAIRDTNMGLRKQLIKQHIRFLECRANLSEHAVTIAQAAIREFAPSIAETLEARERDFFERSVRRALI